MYTAMSFATTPSTPLRWEDGAARRVRGGRRRDDTIAREGRAEDEEGRAMDERWTIADCEAREGGMRDARRIDRIARDGARTVGASPHRASAGGSGRSSRLSARDLSEPGGLDRARSTRTRAPRGRASSKTRRRRPPGATGVAAVKWKRRADRARASWRSASTPRARRRSSRPVSILISARPSRLAGGLNALECALGAATVLPLMLILGVVAAVMSLARDHAF